MARRRFTTDEKVAAVLASFGNHFSHRELCRRQGITTGQLYAWRKRFIQGGRVALETGGRFVSGEFKRLEEENDELKRMLAEAQLSNPACGRQAAF